jgi:hypothetical protein
MTREAVARAGWPALYLCLAGALIAVAGSGLAGPRPEESARRIEDEARSGLTSLAETAAAVAESIALAEEERRRERDLILGNALDTAGAWAEGVAGDRFAAGGPDLLVDLPEGVKVAVIAPSGEVLFEAGGEIDREEDGALLASAGGGLTVAVAWAERAPGLEDALAPALRSTLGPGVGTGTGLVFIGPEGEVALAVSPRPAPDADLLMPDSPTAQRYVSGELGSGRLVMAARPVPRLGWTAVAERILPPEVPAEGRRGLAGTLALAGLGLVAATAFAHAVRARAGKSARPRRGDPRAAPFARPVAPRALPRREKTAGATGEGDPSPAGRSIVRLRETLGEPAGGPDLAAFARSPILRALSREVKSPRPGLARPAKERRPAHKSA